MATKSRIPLALQNVFVASQTGVDVERISAPSNGTGFKVFKQTGSGYEHKKVVHQKIPKAPRRIGMIRRGSASSLTSVSSGGGSSVGSNSRASSATISSMRRTGHKAKDISPDSPQAFLENELKARGYSTKQYNTIETGYYCNPNPLQLASYGRIVTKAMYRPDNTKGLGDLLTCGISPNACNKFGESIVHLVSRRGHRDLLLMLIDSGASLKISDDYGRTPLHDACWQSVPNFPTVRLILEADRHLVNLKDVRGTTPLAYVKPQNFAKWINFLKSVMDEFWPVRNVEKDGPDPLPPFCLKKPNSVPLRVPHLVLTLEQIQMVASGDIAVEEALYLAQMSDDDGADDDFYSSEEGDDSESGEDDSDDSDDSSYDDDEEELMELCMITGKLNMKDYIRK